MPLYNIFLPGYDGTIDPTRITGGAGVIPSPAGDSPIRVGLFVQGINAATPAAAAAALQAAIVPVYAGQQLQPANQQGLMHVNTQSTDTTA